METETVTTTGGQVDGKLRSGFLRHSKDSASISTDITVLQIKYFILLKCAFLIFSFNGLFTSRYSS